MHPLVLDGAINSIAAVALNVYQCFLLAASKAVAHLNALTPVPTVRRQRRSRKAQREGKQVGDITLGTHHNQHFIIGTNGRTVGWGEMIGGLLCLADAVLEGIEDFLTLARARFKIVARLEQPQQPPAQQQQPSSGSGAAPQQAAAAKVGMRDVFAPPPPDSPSGYALTGLQTRW